MIWLVLAILLDFAFIQLFKLAQRLRQSAPVVVAANYLMLGFGLLTWLLLFDHRWPPPTVIAFGVGSGAVFVASMLVTNHAFTLAPAGAVLTPFRLSIVIPVALGVLLWQETLITLQFLGLGLSLVALVLMTGGGVQPRGRGMLGWLFLIFLLQGLCGTALRAVHYLGFDAYFIHFIAVAGLSAGTFGFIYVGLRRIPPSPAALRLGLAIGAYNVISFPILLTALARLPGTTFFPLLAGSIVVLDNLFAHFCWREKLSRRALVGVAVALAALGLIVSNHGGQQVAGNISAIEALPEVVAVVRSNLEIGSDSDIRCGADALGANYIGLCLSWISGIAAGVQADVGWVLDRFCTELRHTLMLARCTSPAQFPHNTLRIS